MRNLIRMRNRGQIAFLQNTPLLSLMDADKDEFHFGDRKEIPVQHFIDLVEDRITPWRLGEFGFEFAHGEWYLCFNDEDSIIMTEDGQFFIVSDQREIPIYHTTFTELLTLIKFLTPPTT